MTRLLWLLLSASCLAPISPEDIAITCEQHEDCRDAETCLVQRCIADGTINEGETCNHDRQCADGTVCAVAQFSCVRACPTYWSIDGCRPGDYCRPSPGASGLRGACFPSACENIADCTSGEVCYGITLDIGACLTNCSGGAGVCGGDPCCPLNASISACAPSCDGI